jgi:flagellar hook-length control protein FliK
MESLDHNLRLPGQDAAAPPTVALPTAPTTELSQGGAFADLLARVETPEPAPSRDREAFKRASGKVPAAIEPQRRESDSVRGKDVTANRDDAQREEANPVERVGDDTTARSDTDAASAEDTVQREAETAAKDEAAPVRKEVAETTDKAPDETEAVANTSLETDALIHEDAPALAETSADQRHTAPGVEGAVQGTLTSDPLAAVTGENATVQAQLQAAGMTTADVPLDAPTEVHVAASRPNGAAPPVDAAAPVNVVAQGELGTFTALAPIAEVEGAPLAKSTAVSASPEGVGAVAVSGMESKDASTQRTQTSAPRTVADPESLQRAEQMLDQLRVKLSPKVRQASLTLRPSELGRLMVNIEVKGGKLTASMIAEKPESLAALQQHIPELKAMLEHRGLEVQHIDLSLAQDGSSFDLNAGDNQSNGEGDNGPKPGSRADLGDDASLKQNLTRAIASEDGLDLYA